ncbi:MAG: GH1 family beta-glucosidase [Mycobacterium leprae]
MLNFPAGFVWGSSTSSYQIEGAIREDGRGESIWDRFCAIPGNIANGDTGDVADDHYHRFAADVDLMADLGLKGYRFSVAWPRVQPDGKGGVNQQGLDFYRRLVEKLLSRGITPMLTLNHWDIPQALQDQGGWTNRDMVGWFTDYAEIMARALGDQVPLWITHNEPWCVAFLGYYRGVHAPGVQNDLAAALKVSHHLNLSHGRTVQMARALGTKGKYGMALSLFPTYPKDPNSEADQAAARLSDGYTNRWFFDPMLKGSYPADMLAHYASLGVPLDFIREGDLAEIGGTADFVGANYYHRRMIEAKPGHDLGWVVHDRTPGTPTTDLGWEIVPFGLTDLLLRIKEEYGNVPVYITENGAVFNDKVDPDGEVRDPGRTAYLQAHFAAAHKAIAAGANLKGYFVWSFMDNFEWAFGYDKRFGLVYVDYATQRRIPKASAKFYSQVIARNGLEQ